MAILPIHVYGQPSLRKKARPIRLVDADLVRLVEDMFDTMHNASGIGLAANQVGILKQVLVIDVSEMEETRNQKPLVMINPEIIAVEGTAVMEEGCLSIPDIRDEVERSQTILVRYRDLDFVQREAQTSGLLARVIQHEIDHLNGILFIDHLGKVKQKLLTGRLNKVRRGEVEVGYPIIAADAVRMEPESLTKEDEQ